MGAVLQDSQVFCEVGRVSEGRELGEKLAICRGALEQLPFLHHSDCAFAFVKHEADRRRQPLYFRREFLGSSFRLCGYILTTDPVEPSSFRRVRGILRNTNIRKGIVNEPHNSSNKSESSV